VLARGSSYRVKDSELIQFTKPWARLDGHQSEGGQRTIKLVTDPKPEKTYELDGKTFKRLTLTHTLPVVLFEPNHLQLLSGGPERRRDYLDDILEQTILGYGMLRRQYRRTLAQRNALLKKADHQVETQLFPWNVRLSQLAGQIVRHRTQLVEQLNAEIGPLYKALSSSKTRVTLLYECRWPADNYETQLLNNLESQMQLDLARGFTGSGPHREDLVVCFDDRPAAETASRGETRTAVLALKIIELQILQAARNTTPLLLLDDVFSELDGRRRHALTDYLAAYQTFITTTDADLILKDFTSKTNVIPLS
jgi:DNA replication and repair protein RecF